MKTICLIKCFPSELHSDTEAQKGLNLLKTGKEAFVINCPANLSEIFSTSFLSTLHLFTINK